MPVTEHPIQYLVLTGTLYPDNRFEYRASYLSDNPDVYRSGLSSDVVAELEDEAGNLLLRHPVAASPYCLDGETTREVHIRGAIPFPADTRNVRLVREGARVFDLRVSDRAPELTLTWQPPRIVEHRQAITWEASHPSGLPVTCFVRYSHDNGERWQRVGTSTRASRVEIDFDQLPGGEECLIAVVASDGVNTIVSESPSFAVSVKACQALIFAPADRETFGAGQMIALRGQGFYLEESRPETQALRWRSSRDGELGQGMAVDVLSLSQGEHEITLTAGHEERAGRAAVRIFVQDASAKHDGVSSSV